METTLFLDCIGALCCNSVSAAALDAPQGFALNCTAILVQSKGGSGSGKARATTYVKAASRLVCLPGERSSVSQRARCTAILVQTRLLILRSRVGHVLTLHERLRYYSCLVHTQIVVHRASDLRLAYILQLRSAGAVQYRTLVRCLCFYVGASNDQRVSRLSRISMKSKLFARQSGL